jgi:pimeloyl-ACP methyl ester carboxylesterase
MMAQVISGDGTRIGYDLSGDGPPVILVDGALGYRAFGMTQKLAALLAPRFRAVAYDRRGRGESGDTGPYGIEREVDDIEALIDSVGGAVHLYGISSGAALALEAAIRLGGKVSRLAMYEAPYNGDAGALEAWHEYRGRLAQFLAEGRRDDAVALFMAFLDVPAEQIEGMRHAPMWPVLEAVAPTLAYDAAILGADRAVPVERAASVRTPALVMNGGASYPFMRDAALALAGAIPAGRHLELAGQPHDVSLEVLAPVLIEFFEEGRQRSDSDWAAA